MFYHPHCKRFLPSFIQNPLSFSLEPLLFLSQPDLLKSCPQLSYKPPVSGKAELISPCTLLFRLNTLAISAWLHRRVVPSLIIFVGFLLDSSAENSGVGCSTLDGVSWKQKSRIPSPCWPHCFWCSPGYDWLPGLKNTLQGQGQPLIHQHPQNLLSSRSLYWYWVLLQFRWNILHLALLNFMKFLWAHSSRLSRSLRWHPIPQLC